MAVTLQGEYEIPGTLYAVAVVSISICAIVPYAIDRVLAPRLGSILGTLILPFAATAVSYLHFWMPLTDSVMSDLAYTQFSDLPLLQLLTVTGLWGIDLLIYWFAALLNPAWERGFVWLRVRGMVAIYASLLAVVLVFGGARITFFPTRASTVRVAGVSPPRVLQAAVTKRLNEPSYRQAWATMASGDAATAQRAPGRWWHRSSPRCTHR